MSKLPAKILVIDDDPDVLTAARVVLRQKFESVDTERSPQRLHTLLQQLRYDVILLDMNFLYGKTTGNEGLYWLQQILALYPEQRVVMITAYADIKLAVEAMKHGAADFVVKPWDNDKLEATVYASFQYAQSRKELTHLRQRQSQYSRAVHAPESELIGESAAMKGILKKLDKVSTSDASILLLGENGTGKELAAKYIHQHSPRSDQPFIKVDLGSLTPNLFESELFGHKKGAFTDAREERIGRMELAHGGTLFLDEIGNLALPLQVKLLSVLQNREVMPLGGNKPVPIDVRLVCATNLDLHKAIVGGLFREDLLYRINTVELTIPPLRDRPEDIPALAKHFLKLYATRNRKPDKHLSADALEYLRQHTWPGNIRELQHAVERAVIMSEDDELKPRDFLLTPSRLASGNPDALNLDEMEKRTILSALQKYPGNMSKVARELGVGRTTLYRKLTRYGLEHYKG